MTKRKQVDDRERIFQVIQNLEQAKASGNKLQIKIWTDVLNKLRADQEKRKVQ